MIIYSDILCPNRFESPIPGREKQLSPEQAAYAQVSIPFQETVTTYSHSEILNLAYFIGDAIGLNENSRVAIGAPLNSLPLGIAAGLWSSFAHGSFVTLPANFLHGSVDTAAIVKNAKGDQSNTLITTDDILQQLAARSTSNNTLGEHLRTIILLSGPTSSPSTTLEAAKKLSSNINKLLSIDLNSGIVWDEVAQTGLLLPHLEGKLIGEDGTTTAPLHAKGTLNIKGYLVGMSGVKAEGFRNTNTKWSMDEKGLFRK